MKCKDFEFCGNEADERFTMDFTDVEPGAYIYWCASCGPTWHNIEKDIMKKMDDEPGFKEKFEKAINNAERIDAN